MSQEKPIVKIIRSILGLTKHDRKLERERKMIEEEEARIREAQAIISRHRRMGHIPHPAVSD